MKRGRLVVEVTGCPGADVGRSSSDGRRYRCLLTEAKHGCLDVEVVEWPEAGGGRSSSSGRRDKHFLVEVEYAELVDDEVQTFEEEGLERLEDWRNPHPNRWECGKLQ